MITQLYLMGGLVEGRILSDRDRDQTRTARAVRRNSRTARRLAHKR
jgi:hypothetical protein